MPKWYAVRQGIKPGLYKTWAQCSLNVTGFRGAEYKSFISQQEAQDYLKGKVEKTEKTEKKLEVLEIYTDGACRSNGKDDSKAGYGVYFGDDDERNISKKLQGKIQTNNRAELMGVIEALKILNSTQKAIIYTDSQYVQKGLDQWIHNWKKKNWKTSTGKDVLNQDLWKILDTEKNKKPLAQIKYVTAHVGIKGNEEADKLAVAGCFL
jgi:ribonuclease HI